jgi:L-aminopeptidase/D-esterase-like protein
MHLIEHVHAVILAGGSAFGLDAAAGVMRYLEEHGVGHPVGVGVVPIVPAAVIFDLSLGDPSIRPDAKMGYESCQQASGDPVLEGCVGVGAGARVGGLTGPAMSCKAGLGSALIEIGDGLLVGALVVVNAVGDIVDKQGRILAGSRMPPEGTEFADALRMLPALARLSLTSGQNTTIGVVATNARLRKEEINKVAQMAHNGIAVSVRPAHTMLDGDTIFALASGSAGSANPSVIGAFAAEAIALAVRRAVTTATTLGGLPAGSAITASGEERKDA